MGRDFFMQSHRHPLQSLFCLFYWSITLQKRSISTNTTHWVWLTLFQPVQCILRNIGQGCHVVLKVTLSELLDVKIPGLQTWRCWQCWGSIISHAQTLKCLKYVTPYTGMLRYNKELACTTSTLNYGVYWCPCVIYIWCVYSRTVSPIWWMCFTEIHV